MIPRANKVRSTQLEVVQQPSQNYKMDFETGCIHGMRDELDAMEQVVYKILSTQRYQFPIYSHNYGVELLDLFGEPMSYVCPKLERRIVEALVQDERIESVDGFVFDVGEKRNVHVSFMVHTVFGDMAIERTVGV